ncbi:hypothetical protein ACFQ08_13975, partial [Streptosporangium algeriense]
MYPGSPHQEGQGPYHDYGRPRRSVGGRLLPALLVVGSLGGIGAIMAGLLTYMTPVADEEPYGPPIPQAASTMEVVPPAAGQQGPEPLAVLPAGVGPGGPD